MNMRDQSLMTATLRTNARFFISASMKCATSTREIFGMQRNI
jgi:hypothetical protein